jgi:polysaccharide chain length determinant protein (PEP-CTERM system associated)
VANRESTGDNFRLDEIQLAMRQIWRNRWLGVVVAWGMFLALAITISFVPNRYEASARIYIDTQTVLKPLMAGLAFQPDVDQQVRMLARTLVSRPNIERLRADRAVGWEDTSAMAVQQDVDRLMNKIKVEPLGTGTNVYLISYRDESPSRARRVVDALVQSFEIASSSDKRKDSQDARKFIEVEIKAYETKLIASENALKDFKLRNFGVSGVPAQDYFARVSALSDEVSKLATELNAAEQSRDALRRELSIEPAQLPVEALPGQPANVQTELDSRIEAQRRQLDDLLRRYTDAHPDVQGAKRVLGLLEGQRRAEQEARRHAASAAGTTMAPTNPVYQRIRGSLADAEASVASLRARLGSERAKLDQVRALANRVPQVEAELAQLNRDYEIIRKNYDALVSRRESASLGEKIDQSASLAEFRIIDPPRAGDRPKFPDRVSLMILAIAAALCTGLGASWIWTRLNPVVESLQQLAILSGRQVLGSVSLVADASLLTRQRRNLVAWGFAAVLLILVQGTWLGWMATRAPSV